MGELRGGATDKIITVISLVLCTFEGIILTNLHYLRDIDCAPPFLFGSVVTIATVIKN